MWARKWIWILSSKIVRFAFVAFFWDLLTFCYFLGYWFTYLCFFFFFKLYSVIIQPFHDRWRGLFLTESVKIALVILCQSTWSSGKDYLMLKQPGIPNYASSILFDCYWFFDCLLLGIFFSNLSYSISFYVPKTYNWTLFVLITL